MIGKDKANELFCPNCGMIVETLTGVDKRKHCGYCGIVLENPKP